MDFGLSEEQQLLEETIRSFLRDRVPIRRVREIRDACEEDRELGCPNDREIWAQLAQLGVTGILIPEAQGGSDLSLLDAALVSQALGYAATPAAFLTSSVMVPTALGVVGGAEADAWLAGIAGGDLVFGLAVTEAFSIREAAGVNLDGDVLRGKAMMAIDSLGADFILATLGQDRLAVVRGDAPGLSKTRLITTDATRCTAELTLEGVTPEKVYEGASQAFQRMLDAGRIVLAADALGACESMIEQAVAYSKQRKQFDRVIGSFQAVKHMCAEMIAELEPARSLLWYAAHSFDALPDEAPLMACHALAHISEIGREIASTATQVHGGIGWTDEQNLHFWFKRIGTARHLLGGPEFLRNRAAELQGLAAAS
jgi:alkylation response protein AidB-like acyl-CoA dehydrogenase